MVKYNVKSKYDVDTHGPIILEQLRKNPYISISNLVDLIHPGKSQTGYTSRKMKEFLQVLADQGHQEARAKLENVNPGKPRMHAKTFTKQQLIQRLEKENPNIKDFEIMKKVGVDLAFVLQHRSTPGPDTKEKILKLAERKNLVAMPEVLRALGIKQRTSRRNVIIDVLGELAEEYEEVSRLGAVPKEYLNAVEENLGFGCIKPNGLTNRELSKETGLSENFVTNNRITKSRSYGELKVDYTRQYVEIFRQLKYLHELRLNVVVDRIAKQALEHGEEFKLPTLNSLTTGDLLHFYRRSSDRKIMPEVFDLALKHVEKRAKRSLLKSNRPDLAKKIVFHRHK